MGAGSSKPEDASKHVFSSTQPVRFSQELIDSLQASTETNSTRAKTLDLHISQRVAAELAKLQAKEDAALASLRSELALKDPSSSPDSPSPDSQSPPPSRKETDSAPSSAAVSKEIENLKKKLAERKVLKDLPPEVEKARGAVVQCLRVNDRRPLDCWREVEEFKGAVAEMERQFVEKVL